MVKKVSGPALSFTPPIPKFGSTRKEWTLADGITQSMLQTFKRCRQRSRFELDGWEPVIKSKTYGFGTLFHMLLENYYRGLSRNLKYPNVEKFVSINLAEWPKAEAKKGPFDVKDWLEDMEYCRAVFPFYIKTWAKSDAKRIWEEPETVFDVEWKGFRLRGKVDAPFSISKKRWQMETKTKSQIEEDAIQDVLTFDFQNQFYSLACEIQKKPLTGTLYNVVRKPGLRQGQKEKREDFLRRIEADIQAQPQHYFKRYEAIYPPDEQARFKVELFEMLSEFRAWTYGSLRTWRNDTACMTRFRCPFIGACSSGKMIGYSKTKIQFRELLP